MMEDLQFVRRLERHHRFEASEIGKGDDIAAVWPVHFETARRGGRGAAIADMGAEDAKLQAIVAVKGRC